MKSRLLFIALLAALLVLGILAVSVAADKLQPAPGPDQEAMVQEEVPEGAPSAFEGVEPGSPVGIEAVAWRYEFSSSSGTYTEIVSGTVHGTPSNDDQSFTPIDIGFTFTYDGVDYTQVGIQSNGWIAMGPGAMSSSYYPLSTGTMNNVISALGRDIEGNDTTSELRSYTEGTAPNRVFTVQWKDYKRYGSTYVGDDFDFQIKLYETSNLIEIVYGEFIVLYVATPPYGPQVGLRGASNADYNNRMTDATHDWSNSLAGTSNASSMALSDLIYPANGLTYDWDLFTGVTLWPAAQSGSACIGSDVVYNIEVANTTGVTQSFSLAYTSTWTASGPAATGPIPHNGTEIIAVTVHIPWAAAMGDSDVLTIGASGGGYTAQATATTTAGLLLGYQDYTDAPRPVRDHGVVYWDGKIYKIGGYDGGYQAYLDIYDIATDTWSVGADIPLGRNYWDCDAIDAKIYCASGYNAGGKTELYIYDIGTDTWSTGAPVPEYRYTFASVALGGKYYVIGGYGPSPSPYYKDTIWAYDPGTDTWDTTLTPMSTGRRYHMAGAIGGKIYVAGGYNGSYLSSAEVYDPLTDTWTPIADMPSTWLRGGDAVKHDRYLLIFGGDDNSSAVSSDFALIYDALTDSWNWLPNMPHQLYATEADGDGSDVWISSGRLYEGAYRYSEYHTRVLQCPTTCDPISAADFSWDPDPGLAGLDITFTGVATGTPAISYEWDFGDGDTGLGEVVAHVYGDAGTYTVVMTATNCDDVGQMVVSHDVQVILPPTIEVTPDSLSASQCPEEVTSQDLLICNLGDVPLEWSIREVSPTMRVAAVPAPTRHPAPAGPVAEGPVTPAIADSGVSSGNPVVGTPANPIRPDDIGDAWETMAPLPSARVFNAAIAAGPYVYVIGGTSDAGGLTPTDTNFRYNTADDTWSTMTPMPAALAEIDGIAIGGLIYIPGSDPDSNTYVYDMTTDTWSVIPANGGYAAPVQYQVVAIGTDLYVLGGIIGGASTTNVWVLDTSTGTWAAGVPMQNSRTSFSAAAIGGNIYVAGGVLFPGFVPDMTAEMFDGTSWSYIAPVPDGGGAYTRWSYNADGMAPGALWLGAGRRDAGWAVLNHAGYYDVATDTWTDSPTIPMLAQGRVYMEGDVAADGYFYVIGGRDSTGTIVYDNNERLMVYTPMQDVPWLSEDPITGTVDAQDCATVTVTFDSSGMDPGEYLAGLVIESNDPATPEVNVPVDMTVLECPDIILDPLALETEVCADGTDVLTFTICNEGVTDLDWAVHEYTPSVKFLDEYVVVNVPASEALPGADARPGSSARPERQFEMHIGWVSQETIDVLLVTPDAAAGYDISLLLNTLAAFPDLNVTLWDGLVGTPTVPDMLAHDVVFVGNDILWTSSAIDKTALSNNLADYIDAGGKVLAGSFVWSYDDWGFMGGRFITEDYSPYEIATQDFWVSATLGAYDPDHPIMAGITSATDNVNHQDMALSSTGTWIASWNDGENFVAESPNCVGLNQLYFYSADFGGQVGELLHNSLLYLATGAWPDIPWISEEPVTGTVPPGECQVVDVTFDASGLTPGDYFAGLLVESNDPDDPEVSLLVTMTVLSPVELVDVTYLIADLEVTFDATATGSEPIAFEWDFGDGNTSNEEDPIHVYAEGGCYTVTLTVQNPCGVDEWSELICVAVPCEPIGGAGFDWSPVAPIVGETVTFSATVPLTGTGPFTYTWDFDDGSGDVGMYVNHTFAAAATYSVTLMVENACSEVPVVVPITVEEAPPPYHYIYLPIVIRD